MRISPRMRGKRPKTFVIPCRAGNCKRLTANLKMICKQCLAKRDFLQRLLTKTAGG